MQPRWRPAYIAVGSNLRGPQQRAADAMERIATVRQTRVELRSRLYLTRPMGPQHQPDFVNAAVGVLTRLSAFELLQELLSIEREMGRNRGERWGPRIIDLDLIWMSGETHGEPSLMLPHPGVSERNFVLYPLNDIAPTLEITGYGTVHELKGRASTVGIAVIENPCRSAG